MNEGTLGSSRYIERYGSPKHLLNDCRVREDEDKERLYGRI